MALIHSNISSNLATIFQDQVIAYWNRAVVLTKLLPVVECNNVQSYVWNIAATDGSSGNGSHTDGDDFSSFTNDTYTKAELPFCTYAEAFSMSLKAISAAANTGNPADLANLFSIKLMEAVARLAAHLNTEWYSGPGTTDRIAGLADSTNGALKATGSYAGLTKGTPALFVGNESLNGGVPRALSVPLMREMSRSIYTASGMAPDLIVCDPIQFQKYGELIDPHRRYVSEVNTAAANGKILLDGGYQALEFDGVPVVRDKDAPAGQMLFLNSAHVKIVQMPLNLAGNMPGGGEFATIDLKGTPEAQYGMGNTSLKLFLYPLAMTGDAVKFVVQVYPNIVVDRVNACGLLGDLIAA